MRSFEVGEGNCSLGARVLKHCAVRQSTILKVSELVGTRSGTSEIAFRQECGATSVSDWWPILRGREVVSSSKFKNPLH